MDLEFEIIFYHSKIAVKFLSEESIATQDAEEKST